MTLSRELPGYAKWRERAGIDKLDISNVPNATTAVNPFKRGAGWNLTAAMEIERRDPALAARLKALAEERLRCLKQGARKNSPPFPAKPSSVH